MERRSKLRAGEKSISSKVACIGNTGGLDITLNTVFVASGTFVIGQWLVERDAAPSTVNHHLATLRVYAKWIGIPVTVKGVEEQSLAPRWLDKKEQTALVRETEKVINAAQTQAAKIQGLRDRAVIVILLNCGLRISELCNLSINDVELSDRKGKLIIRQGRKEKSR